MAKQQVTRYFVVDAPGHYGDVTRVWSSHHTLPAALKAARPIGSGSHRYVVREGGLRKGDPFLRVYEETYPIARGSR